MVVEFIESEKKTATYKKTAPTTTYAYIESVRTTNLKDDNGVSRCSTTESQCKGSSNHMVKKQSGTQNVEI
jgi:hypothetical protein